MASKKKDFTQVNTGRVYASIEESIADPAEPQTQEEQQARYTQEELEAIRAAGKTQGRKGAKAIRFNMAFTPDIYAYITTMARVRGETVTQFTNYVFSQSMKDNAELYEKAKQFTESFK